MVKNSSIMPNTVNSPIFQVVGCSNLDIVSKGKREYMYKYEWAWQSI